MESLKESASQEAPHKEKENDMAAPSPQTVLADLMSEFSDSEEFVDPKFLEEEKQAKLEREERKAAEQVGSEEEVVEEEEEEASRQEERRPAGDGMDQLSWLLKQSTVYSEFMAKQLAEETRTPPKANSANATSEKGKKRKGGDRKGAKAKKQKKEDEAAAALKSALLAKEEEKARESPERGDAEEKARAEQKVLMPDFQGKMRSYQVEGVKWIISLWQNGLNGILADQMGLGKTVQTIGFFSHLKSNGLNGPFIVVAPLSTLTNWTSEFTRWAPHIPQILYHGSKAERLQMQRTVLSAKIDKDFPVIITSFEIVMNDVAFLRKFNWKYLVVDEGHRLKNYECQLIQRLKELKCDNRLLLSGTPLQNNLTELWSLLNFLLPTMFANLEQFESWFDIDGNGRGDRTMLDEEARGQVVSKLHVILKPFLLRRMKIDVENSVPGKKEIVLYAQMTPLQQKYHEQLINETLHEHLAQESGGSLRGRLKNLMMQMRKNCNHPDLLISEYDDSLEYPPVEELIEQCGKLQLLDRLLTRLRAEGHKVLIFSQMTRVLDILAYYLEQRGHTSVRIDGSVKSSDRKESIEDFSSDPNLAVFLLSTRAGGLGINLTSADTVIIYDSDWNPHQDMQAQDRCHRIGQTKPVHVYRLITAHSVECKMLQKAGGKLKLEHMVITKGNFRIENLGKQSTVQDNELRALVEPQMDEREELVQSEEISAGDMDKLFDRSDLELREKGQPAVPSKLPMYGRGWSVVATSDTPSVLNTVR